MSVQKRHFPLRVVITVAFLGVVSSALAQVEPMAGASDRHFTNGVVFKRRDRRRMRLSHAL
jgi:hypothetical protein